MPNLSLRERRMRARGINPRLVKLWGRRTFMGLGNRATLTTNLTGANNDLFYMSRTPGTGGNAITIAYTVAGASTPLSVAVATKAITVTVATTAGSAASSTAIDIERAIRLNTAANALVHVNRAPGNDGTGVVTALTATALSGAS